MLLEMNIRNIALIERLRVEFACGLNVLTGETGAGKSIVIDAMNLALGGRADRELIRSGAERALVQAVFDVRGDARVLSLLEEMGLEAEEGYLTIGRELSAGGRNLCRVAGTVVPLAQLKALSSALVEMHGQHEHQELLSPARHLRFLDNYGDEAHGQALERVRACYAKYGELKRETDALTRSLAERERRLDTLSHQLEEINAVKPKKGEDERLEKQFKLMENAEKVSSSVEKAYHLVYQGSERAPSVQDALKRAAAAMNGIADLDGRFEEIARKLDELYYAAQDAGYELQDILDSLEFDPAGFDKTGARLDALDKLKRKYGPELDDVLAFRERAEQEMKALGQGDERLEELKGEFAAAKSALTQACAALSAARRHLAEAFSEAVLTQLKELGMTKVRFHLRFEGNSADETLLSPRGTDTVEFMISPNPGEPLKPLSSTASGGELSRIMLALKVIMADRDEVGTMIFDEIDTGISGHMAQVVGEKMAAIGRGRQVIAVSHLPQIAALADAHFLVEKTVQEGRTGSTVARLDEEGRVDELARMVGGAGDPESGRRHARNMRAAAEEIKQHIL